MTSEEQTISAWLDGIKPGFGDRYLDGFDEAGYEDVSYVYMSTLSHR